MLLGVGAVVSWLSVERQNRNLIHLHPHLAVAACCGLTSRKAVAVGQPWLAVGVGRAGRCGETRWPGYPRPDRRARLKGRARLRSTLNCDRANPHKLSGQTTIGFILTSEGGMPHISLDAPTSNTVKPSAEFSTMQHCVIWRGARLFGADGRM